MDITQGRFGICQSVPILPVGAENPFEDPGAMEVPKSLLRSFKYEDVENDENGKYQTKYCHHVHLKKKK